MRLPAAALLLCVTAACHAADEPVTGISGNGGASLRVINAAARPVDVVVDGQVVLASLGAESVSSRLALSGGAHAVVLRDAGAVGGATLSLTATAGQTSTVAALPDAGQIGAATLVDTGAAPVAGKSKLRVIHLAANAPSIDIWRTQPDYATPIRVMFPFAYRAQSPYLQSTPGDWTVSVTAAGQTAPTLASSGPIAVAGGDVRTVVVLDAPGGGVQVKTVE